MKPIRLFALLAMLGLAFALCVPMLAQDTNGIPDAVRIAADTIAPIAQPWIAQFAVAHPWVLTFFGVLGAIGFLLKPITTAWHMYVAQTPDEKDDVFYGRVTNSTAWKWALFLIDWLLRIKPSAQVIKKTSMVLLCVGLAGTLALPLTGCSSTAQRRTYQASAVSHTTVTAAVRAWNDYLGTAYAQAGTNAIQRAQLIGQEKLVRDAFNKYQLANLAVIDASAAYSATAVSTNGPPAQDQLQTALNAAAAAGADVLALLAQFGIKTGNQ